MLEIPPSHVSIPSVALLESEGQIVVYLTYEVHFEGYDGLTLIVSSFVAKLALMPVEGYAHPQDIQTALQLAGHDAGHYARATGTKMDEELMAMLSKKMQVNEVNFDSFVKASKPLYDDYPKEFGKDGKWILDNILAAK